MNRTAVDLFGPPMNTSIVSVHGSPALRGFAAPAGDDGERGERLYAATVSRIAASNASSLIGLRQSNRLQGMWSLR